MYNIEDIKPLKIYNKKMDYPMNKDDFTHRSLIFLLGSKMKPDNYDPKYNLIINQRTTNNSHKFRAYYIPWDISYIVTESGISNDYNENLKIINESSNIPVISKYDDTCKYPMDNISKSNIDESHYEYSIDIDGKTYHPLVEVDSYMKEITKIDLDKAPNGYGVLSGILNDLLSEGYNQIRISKKSPVSDKIISDIFSEYSYDELDSEYTYTILEHKLKKDERTDFGVPELKKYPMPDKEHVIMAIRFFNKCPDKYKPELAKNIKKKIKEYHMEDEIHVSEKNEFYQYYNESTTLTEDAQLRISYDNVDKIKAKMDPACVRYIEEYIIPHYYGKNKNLKDEIYNIYEYCLLLGNEIHKKNSKFNFNVMGLLAVFSRTQFSLKYGKKNVFSQADTLDVAMKDEFLIDHFDGDALSSFLSMVSDTFSKKGSDKWIYPNIVRDAFDYANLSVDYAILHLDDEYEDYLPKDKTKHAEALYEYLYTKYADPDGISPILKKYLLPNRPFLAKQLLHIKEFCMHKNGAINYIESLLGHSKGMVFLESTEDTNKIGNERNIKDAVEVSKIGNTATITRIKDGKMLGKVSVDKDHYTNDIAIADESVIPYIFHTAAKVLGAKEAKISSVDQYMLDAALNEQWRPNGFDKQRNLQLSYTGKSYKDSSKDISIYKRIIPEEYLDTHNDTQSIYDIYNYDSKEFIIFKETASYFDDTLEIDYYIKNLYSHDDTTLKGLREAIDYASDKFIDKRYFIARIPKEDSNRKTIYESLGFQPKDEFKDFYLYELDSFAIDSDVYKESSEVIYPEEIPTKNELNEVTNPIQDKYYSIDESTADTILEGKYDSKIKRAIYHDRIRKTSDVLAMYQELDTRYIQFKKVFPNKYTQIRMYKKFNLLVDLGYYIDTYLTGIETNRLFAANDFKGRSRAFYELVFHMIHNDEYKDYNKRTVIFFLDYYIKPNESPIDQINYKKSINPLTMLMYLMEYEPTVVRDLFKDYQFVFYAFSKSIRKPMYLKIDFSKYDMDYKKKNFARIKTLILSLIRKEIAPNDLAENEPDSKLSKTLEVISKLDPSNSLKINSTTSLAVAATIGDNTNTIHTSTALPNITDTKRDIDKEKKVKYVESKNALVKKVTDAVEDPSKDADTIASEIKDEEAAKDLMENIERYKPNSSTDISVPRQRRMEQLRKELIKKEMKRNGQTVHTTVNTQPIAEYEDCNISTISPEWNHMKFSSFDKNYDLDGDIRSIITCFANKSKPLILTTNIDIQDTSTSEDWVETYAFTYEDAYGKRSNVKIDIPIFHRKRFMKLRGNEKTIQGQLTLLPISKTEPDTVQIVSNYNKIFVRAANCTAGRTTKETNKFFKWISKIHEMKQSDIEIYSGKNALSNRNYNCPEDYYDLSDLYDRIVFKDKDGGKHTLYFGQKSLWEHIEADPKLAADVKDLANSDGEYKFICGIHDTSKNKSLWTASYRNFIRDIMASIQSYIKPDYITIYESIKPSTRLGYSQASLMAMKIPLVFVVTYALGLIETLKRSSIEFTIKENTRQVPPEDLCVKLKDCCIDIPDNSIATQMLINGLNQVDLTDYTLADTNTQHMWLEILDLYGGRLRADGLENFVDLMIDPITAEVCEHVKVPSDYIDLLIYSNQLLASNEYVRHVDLSSNRYRGKEIIAGYFYKVMAIAYAQYKLQVKNGLADAKFSIKQSALIDAIFADNTFGDLSATNALSRAEVDKSVSFKGLSGLNSERGYNTEKRMYDNSMINKLAMSTGFATTAGVNRQCTIDMDIDTYRGYIKKTDIKQMSVTKSLGMTEAMSPYSSTHDDPMRQAMNLFQTYKHYMRVICPMPQLVTLGTDEALPYLTDDTYSVYAKANGKVVELKDGIMVVKYTDGTFQSINVEKQVVKNSDGGFYFTNKLTPTMKLGATFKKGEIIAYDKGSYVPALNNEKNKVAFSLGTWAKAAIILTDEGFEDSTRISRYLSEAMTSDVVVMKDITLDKNTNVYNILPKGSEIHEGEELMNFQRPFEDEDANILMKNLAADSDTVTSLGKIPIKSKITGVIQDIKMYRTVELNELSPSLKKLFTAYENNIAKKKAIIKKYKLPTEFNDLPPNYKLPATGKLKNAEDSVRIEFYLKYKDKMSNGDKLVFNAGLKGVVKDLIPAGLEPYTVNRPEEKIHAYLSFTGPMARMVTSLFPTGGLYKTMVELDRAVKKIYGLKPVNLDKFLMGEGHISDED